MSPSSGSSHRPLRAASPQRKSFDPWNTCSTGHQRAENRLGGSTGWRDSRAAKLQEQWRGGMGNSGGRRMYDLVGEGAADEGVAYFMKKEGIASANEYRPILQKDTEQSAAKQGSSYKMSGAEMEWLKNTSKRENRDAVQDLRGWDAVVREEAICLEVRGRKRSCDNELEKQNAKRLCSEEQGPSLSSQAGKGTVANTVRMAEESDEVWDELFQEVIEDGEVLHSIVAAADDDEIWEESPDAVSTETKAPDNNSSNDIQPAPPDGSESSEPTPPCGQTTYANHAEALLSLETRRTPSTRTRASASFEYATSVASSDLLVKPPKAIFAGLTIHLSGPTLPLISDHAIRQMLVSRGATVLLHMARKQITHVVVGTPSSYVNGHGSGHGAGGVLAARKLDQEMRRLRSATGGPGIRFVRLEWVLESVRAGKRLAESRFAINTGSQSESEDVRKRALTDTTSHELREHGKIPRNSPLTHSERAQLGSEMVEMKSTEMMRGKAKEAPQQQPRAVAQCFQKSLVRTAVMPGAPPGVPSIRSLFLKQHRDNAWTKAGFVVRKR